MQIKKWKRCSGAALGTFMAAVAGPLAANSGWYVGGGAGRSALDSDGRAIDTAAVDLGLVTTSDTRFDDTDSGWKIFMGYDFNRYLALEGGYVDLGEASSRTVTTGPDAIVEGQFEAQGLTLDAIGSLPLGDRFSVLAKLGIFRWDVDARYALFQGGVQVSKEEPDDSETDVKAGVGVRYRITGQLAARIEFERFFDVGNAAETGQSDIDLTSLSILYLF